VNRRPRRSRAPALLLLLVAALGAACAPAVPATPPGSAAPTSTPSNGTPPPSTPSTRPPSSPGLAPVGRTETARVVRVVDGDTIIVDRGHGNERLRYIGMNTPETVKPDTPVEWMGPEASAANKTLVDGREVVLEKDVSETDQYGRLLRYVWLREGDGWLMVDLELVRLGFAQVSTFPPDVRWVDALIAAQRAARNAGVGLWGPRSAAP
jgi:micrococcal nuclease